MGLEQKLLILISSLMLSSCYSHPKIASKEIVERLESVKPNIAREDISSDSLRVRYYLNGEEFLYLVVFLENEDSVRFQNLDGNLDSTYSKRNGIWKEHHILETK